MVRELNNQFAKVPESVMNASQQELKNREMEVIEGNLPDDLQGYVFVVAPVGNVDTGELPYEDGNTFLSGDGMIYQLDLTESGRVKLKTQIVKPPDYIAEFA